MKNKITVAGKPCFMCKRSDYNYQEPAEGRLAVGTRIDYRATNARGEYKQIPFRGYVCDMHADSQDITSIRFV